MEVLLMKNTEEFVVLNQRCAGFLMLQGFVLQRIEVNFNDVNRRKNVFIFKDSEALRKTIDKYKEFTLLSNGSSN